MEIIDAHVHLDDVINTKFSKEKRMKLLLQNMKSNKVKNAFVLADVESVIGESFFSNEQMAEFIQPYKNLHLVGKVPLKYSSNNTYLKKLKRLISEKVMRGIKIYPGYEYFYPYDKRYKKVYGLCREFDVPLMIHTGDISGKGILKYSTPLHVDELANKYPDLKIIICHMGNPWHIDTATVTLKNDNVYADTSGLFYKKLDDQMKKFLQKKIEEFIQWNGKGEKLIFGSDWPITDMRDSIKLIRSLPHFSNKEKKLIFEGNARKLFNLNKK